MSRQAADQGAQAILWPESSTPFYFEDSPKGEAIRLFARERGASVLLGSDEIDRRNPARVVQLRVHGAPGRQHGWRVPQGAARARSANTCRSGRVLFFAAPLVEAVGEFAPGDAPVMLPLAGRPVSTAICYEVVYPALIRAGVLQGSTLLTTITNDAWFGRSSAPYQHFEMASMRAIEQGRYLARSANTGISGIVDPYGRVLMASELFTTQVLVGEVRLIEERTIYARIGDVVAYASVVVTLAALLMAWRRRATVPHAGAHTLGSSATAACLHGGFNWLSCSKNSFAGTRSSPGGRPRCGGIFEAARPAEELRQVEARSAEPDFWKDQALAQRLLQRRRRLEEDVTLAESLRRSEPTISPCSSSGPSRAKTWPRNSIVGSTSWRRRSRPPRSARCSGANTTGGTPSSRFILAPAAPSRRTGRRCCCACTCAGSSAAA